MPKIEFTPQLAQHVACQAESVTATTLRKALDIVFDRNPQARNYILNDHGSVRQHVAIFIDSRLVHERENLNIPLHDNSEVYVMQALSGG
jgi:sulfur-carrier protein